MKQLLMLAGFLFLMTSAFAQTAPAKQTNPQKQHTTPTMTHKSAMHGDSTSAGKDKSMASNNMKAKSAATTGNKGKHKKHHKSSTTGKTSTTKPSTKPKTSGNQ